MAKPPVRPARRALPPDADPPGNPAVVNWGLRLIGIGLVGLLLPTVGLTFRKLEAIGDAQWIVLACVVAAGSVAFFWGNRHRPAFAGAVTGGALVLVPMLAYVSFWRHAKEPAPVAQTSPPPRRNQVIPQTRVAQPPPEALHGRIHRLGVEISGDFSNDELVLISEFVLDCEPDAESVQTYLTRKPDQEKSTFFPTVWVGPVDNAEEFLAQLKFGTVSIVAAERIRIEVHRPLGPPAESVRNRVAAALDALRSGDASRLPATFKMLAKLVPLARREEVAAELLGLLATPKPAHATPRLGESPAEALKRWAMPEQTEAIKQLVGQEGINQADVFDVLGTVSPEVAVQVARDLIAGDERLPTYVLARMGAPAEKSVLDFLQDPDAKVRKVGCEVLKSIGTEASIEPLKALKNDPVATIATEANRAVSMIQGRSRKK